MASSGLMQGIIVTPSGDVWSLGLSKNQLVYFPKGDLTKGRIVCEGREVEPCKSFQVPFHLGHRPAGPDLGDQRGLASMSRGSRPPTRARSRRSKPAGAAADLASTARAMSG